MSRKYYRYFLYVLEVFLLFIIEGTPCLLPQFYLAKPLLLVSLAVSLAAFESPLCALVFGVLCGMVIDAGSGGVMGFSAIILAVICFYESYWNTKYIKNSIYLVLVYSAVASAAIISLKFFIFYFIKKYPGASESYVTHYLPRIVYTWAVTPLVYLLTLLVSKTFRKEKRKIKVRRKKRVLPSQRSGASRRRAKQSL